MATFPLMPTERPNSVNSAPSVGTGRSSSHIVPVIIGDNARVMALCEAALERGVYAQGIRHPSVPAGTERIRFTPICAHTPEQIAHVLDVFRELH